MKIQRLIGVSRSSFDCSETSFARGDISVGAFDKPGLMRKRSKVELQGVKLARNAHLIYVNDTVAGFRRVLFRKSFRYTDSKGSVITDASILKRIHALAIPPAWREVWICPVANGHLQATGRDSRGRKQYRYHPHWREIRDETKYDRMLAFARALPRIRRRVARDLKEPDLSRCQILATVVRLLDLSLIRVGNDEYARENHSYGLTTMKNRHAKIQGSTVRFQFRGKSGKQHSVAVHDARLARIIRKCRDIPGQDLFQYVDGSGNLQHVHSEDVNEYLRAISEGDFTAKDFRTWTGTVLASDALRGLEPFRTAAQAKRNVVAAVMNVASRLGNTPAICRKCYINPQILTAYLRGSMMRNGGPQPVNRSIAPAGLRSEEAFVATFLKKPKDGAK